MDTITQIRATGAAVTGARHLRTARNGQDAAAVWIGEGAGAVVVCDGCGSGTSSEVGARLGAQLVIAALSRELGARASLAEGAMWAQIRGTVAGQLGALVDAVAGACTHGRIVGEAARMCTEPSCAIAERRARFIHEHLLFTVVAAAVAQETAAVWAIGDGAYAIAARTRTLGPFPDNQPPYLAYDLLDMAQQAHVETIDASGGGAIVVSTDGVAELGLDVLSIERCLAHPDALRRRLTVLARGSETIEWDARRVVRTPALLQDDGAAAILAWRGRPS